MSDKDFKVKNKLQVKGITTAGPITADSSGNIDSVPHIATQFGGTGTTTSPSTGQIPYSTSGTTYTPTALNTLDVKGSSYSADAPSNPVVGQIWVESDTTSDSFDPNIIRRKSFTATAAQTVFTTDLEFIQGYEQVFFNGMLLLRNSDYTTASNTNVTLASGAAAGDIVEIVSITNLNSINTATTTTNTFTGNQIINGSVGVNTGSPVNALSVNGDMNLTANQAYTTNLYYNAGAWKYVGNGAAGWMKLPDTNGIFTLSSAPNNTNGAGATATTTEVLRTDIGGQNFFINNSNGNISPTWIMTNTDNSGATWIKLGVFTAGNFGNELKINLTGHSGFNAAYYQNFEGVIRFKTSNGGSVDANGFAGDGYWYHQGGAFGSSGLNAVKIVANAAGVAATNYTVYISTSSYTYGSIYNVQITPGTTWTPNTALGVFTDPGVASSSLLVLQNIGVGQVLISTTPLSGTSTTISSIPSGFKNLRLILSGISPSANDRLQLSWNSNSAISSWANWAYAGAATTLNTQTQLNTTSAYLSSTRNVRTSNGTSSWFVDIYDYANPSTAHPGIFGGFYLEGTNYEENINGVVTFNGSGGAMTSLVVKFNGTNTFAAGTAYLYGVR